MLPQEGPEWSPARQSPSPASGGRGTHDCQTVNVDLSHEEQVHRVGGGSGTHSLWTGSVGRETQRCRGVVQVRREGVSHGGLELSHISPHGAVRPSRVRCALLHLPLQVSRPPHPLGGSRPRLR